MISPGTEKIGEILVKKGLISRETLDKYLSVQKVTKEPLLKILMDNGVIDEVQQSQLLAEQWGFDFVDLAKYPIEKEILRYTDPEKAKIFGFFVFKKEGPIYHVAISDPTNIDTVDYVRAVYGMNVKFYVTPKSAIIQTIEKYYELENVVKKAEEEFTDVEVVETVEENDLSRLRMLGEDAPVVRLVNSIISQAIVEGASDIHVEPMEDSLRVRYRIDGILHEKQRLPKRIQPGVIARLKIISNMDIAERRLPQDGRISLKFEGRPVDFRVSSLPSIYGEKIVLRILDKTSSIKPLEQLGFSEENLKKFEKIITQPYGMILISGPTGSGKTTTLYSILNRLNAPTKNIITVEDPVEYQLKGINQVQVNEKAGLTFANALRSILRQDPNIILIGEIRDRETAQIAIEAALTGHLVLSTIHTNDSASIPTRLIDMGIEPFLVASSLIGATAQRLIRKICPKCKEPHTPSKDVLEHLGFEVHEGVNFYKGAGCDFCSNTGYKGRVAISEILPITPEIQRLILKQASSKEILSEAKRMGMKTLLDDALMKAAEGITTLEEVIRVVSTLEVAE
ncbi:GspE/PulE family protein [Caldisericum exile]|uniref:Type 4 fimbrial assembly protein PilB n=1 Tax=Caldisericum exile (strain DSM 21853 / NBRC 104410 / AZM16c01) TaxID=511051 RepID=A0A7U6GFR8_CALEA|nr:GspE/PulE family protein [Caldisericum exile]BAL81598.1 type 4 fimbrial assembly protein PilB [Caldisericum exile AZM16c01]